MSKVLRFFKQPRWQLYRAISISVVEAFCFSNSLINSLLHIVCLPFVLELTRLGNKMEGIIRRDKHLKGASQWLVEIATRDIHIHNAANVPAEGPVLFIGNHAGLGDAHALLMSSSRRDTLVLAHNFGILPGLPAMREHVIVVDKHKPLASLRASLQHLKAGGSLLLFPCGEIEADPGLYLDSALETLAEWSGSIDLFACHVPGLAIVPFAVGGVISRRALSNPIVRLYRNSEKRHFLAATFQLMFPFYRDPVISLFYGPALYGATAAREKALAQMEKLLSCVHAEQQSLIQ